jgi:competence protein ComEA
MRKIVALLMLCVSFVFAAINLQTATKEELMEIKGIGDKKADQIIEYRKTNKINEPEDLKNIKGIGDSIVSSVKESNMDTKEKAEKKMENKKEDSLPKK